MGLFDKLDYFDEKDNGVFTKLDEFDTPTDKPKPKGVLELIPGIGSGTEKLAGQAGGLLNWIGEARASNIGDKESNLNKLSHMMYGKESMQRGKKRMEKLGEFGKYIKDFWLKQAETGVEKTPKELQQEDAWSKYPISKGARVVGEAVPSLGAAVIASIIGGPKAGAAVLSGLAGGSTYGEAREKGSTVSEASEAATMDAAWNMLSEGIPLGRMFNRAGKPLFERIIKGMAEEGIQEFVQGRGSNLIKQLTYDPQKDFLKKGLWEGGLSDIVGGAGSGGIGGAVIGKGNTEQLARLLKQEHGVFGGKEATGYNEAKNKFSNLMDKQERFEIDDSKSQLKTMELPYLPEIATQKDKTTFQSAYLASIMGQGSKPGIPLNKVLKHAELFKQYPDLKNMKVVATNGMGKGAMALDVKKGIIKVNQDFMNEVNTTGSYDLFHSILLHEIQHQIQEIEGFAKGGSVQSEGSKEAYRKLAGEIEARDVMVRKNLTSEQRKMMQQYTSQGIPLEDVVVKMKSEGDISKFEQPQELTEPLSDFMSRQQGEEAKPIDKSALSDSLMSYMESQQSEVEQQGKPSKLDKSLNDYMDFTQTEMEQDVPTQKRYNLNYIKTSKEGRKALNEAATLAEAELTKEGLHKKLSKEEILTAAQASEILTKAVSRDDTKEMGAAIEVLQQEVARLAETGEINETYINHLKVLLSSASNYGRGLNWFKSNTATPEQVKVINDIMKRLIKLGHDTEAIIKAAEGVDFTNKQQVTDFYRKFEKASWMDQINEYRYINLLSSPSTHITNIFTNALQVGLVRPITRTVAPIFDWIKAGLTGSKRQFTLKQVPAYFKGLIQALPKATSDALKAFSGKTFIGRPDVNAIPTNAKWLKPFKALHITEALEAMDVFFRTLAYNAEIEAIKAEKGKLSKADEMKARLTASKLVFRNAIDPKNKTGQGYILSAIDNITSVIYKARTAPFIGKPISWFIPFVQTPMSIAKFGIELSPVGYATMWGASPDAKVEKMSKATVGSMISLWAGLQALAGNVTWSAPTGEKEKKLFYSSGRQPYSIKIGGKWVSYSRLGPVGFPIALAASMQWHMKENPSNVSKAFLEKITKGFAGVMQYFSEQSYLEGVGNLQRAMRGDVTALNKLIMGVPQQMVPFASAQRWAANLIDPIYRKPDKSFSLKGFKENFIRGLPGLSKSLESYKDIYGKPSKRQDPLFNALSPLRMTKPDKLAESLYKTNLFKKRLTAKKKGMKEKLMRR